MKAKRGELPDIGVRVGAQGVDLQALVASFTTEQLQAEIDRRGAEESP